ncbi:hypothetical protein PIROE2DRAFT_2617, partial [Piromyces sp. E2]
MIFNQLKTLLWRNVILKRRGLVSTLLEVIIPTLIILIIAQNSGYVNTKNELKRIDDSPIIPIESDTLLWENNENKQISLGIKFSQDFNEQMKNTFIENVKINKLFSNFTLLSKEQSFTTVENITINDETNIPLDNLIKKEYKIFVSNNELDLKDAYKESIEEKTNKNLYKFYGIIFKSLTKYEIRFGYKDKENEELVEKSKIENTHEGNSMNYNLLAVQNIVDKSLVKTLTNIPEYTVNTKIMDREGYVIYIIEKESRIKESLVIIGLRKSSFWVSWAITYGLIITISSALVTFAMYYFKFFTTVHWSVTIVVMIVFGLSCCCISFILSTLIKKSKTANTVGVMVIIGFFAMYFLQFYIKKYKTSKWVCSLLLSPIAFLSIFDDLIKYEEQILRVTYITIFGNKSLRNSFLCLLFTFVLYFIIAVYLDNVLPQGNNFNKKWHFFITDLFRRKHKKSDDGVNYNSNNPYIQEDPEGLNKAVEVKNVGKNFKVKGESIEILKSINFNAYYDEIFAILGHNGAGKTTLMSIMTGILSASRGEVYYDDVPITGNETDICRQFGYCPQFDTFNSNLTVGEHVKLFAGIKGVKVNVDDVLEDIDLLEKKNNFPKQLSGGQKRKLCITLALLGSPKYVFLDEPTT